MKKSLQHVLLSTAFLLLFCGSSFAQRFYKPEQTQPSRRTPQTSTVNSSNTRSAMPADEYGVPRLSLYKPSIVKDEPLKFNLWSATTLPRGLFVLHPQIAANLHEENNFVTPSMAIHYGMFNNFDFTLIAGFGVMLSDNQGGDDIWLDDIPLHFRYRFIYNQNWDVTAKVSFTLPVCTLVDTNFQNGYELQMQYKIPGAPMAIMGNLGYNFMFKRDGVKPPDYLNYGFGAEYTIPDLPRMHLLLEITGANKGMSKQVTPAVSYNLSPSSLLRGGLSFPMDDPSTVLAFTNATFRF